MVYVVFSLDYEIFGNGSGGLKELVFSPTESLLKAFDRYNYKLVTFVESYELIEIKRHRADECLDKVEEQIQLMYAEGHEIGLHIHSQWGSSEFKNDTFHLDMNKRNIAHLPETEINKQLKVNIRYLKSLLGEDFQPLSFRAGLLTMQPTNKIYSALVKNKIQVDSSFYKGGRCRNNNINYTKFPGKAYWPFSDNIRKEDPDGKLLEVPIWTKMVPFYEMLNKRRLSVHKKRPLYRKLSTREKINEYFDKLRPLYPQKLDYCKMSPDRIINTIRKEASKPNDGIIPIVLYGHSKNLPEIEQINKILDFLNQQRIPVTTFKDLFPTLKQSLNNAKTHPTT